MLGFFQKYQRFFFIFVTVLVIGSFAFFGVLDTFTNNERVVDDFSIGKSIDGSPMMRSEVQRLSRFIATDRGDFSPGSRETPNFCNDGVIRNDLLRTGLSDLLISSYFDSFKEALQHRLDRAKKYRGYEHPEASFISARTVWDRLIPSVGKELDSLQAQEEASVSTFSRLSRLYQQQSACPPEFLRRVLMYYHNQASWVKPDPQLQYVDLSLFGYHTVSDWFGPNFVDCTAQFILNAAKYAEQKGYRVSSEEAKGDLIRNFKESMQKLSDIKQPAGITFSQHIHSLGFDEKSAVEAWRSVLLFRRYFHGIGESTFIDRLPYRDFASFTRETSMIQKYEWPEALRMNSAQDLIEFQVYTQSIAAGCKGLSLPTSFMPLETIAKQTPELVLTTYRMKIAVARIEEIGLRATLKELLDWQLDDQNWNEMCLSFPFLEKRETKEARYKLIERLSSQNRAQMDLYTRSQLVGKNPQWIEEQFRSAVAKEQAVSVAANWISLPEITSPNLLAAMLESAALGDEDAKSFLEKYSDQGRTFYRFEEVEKIKDEHIATFEEAKNLGLMALVADRYLEAEYVKLRPKMRSRFQVKEGEWKLFSSVKEEVAAIVFADLLKGIGGENMPLAYYAAHRLEIPAKEAWASLQKNPNDLRWLSMNTDPITDQFKFVKTECPVQRTNKDEWMKEQVLIMMPNEWSPIHIPADGNITFFYFEKKKPHEEPILEQISFGKEVIAADAQRYAAEALLSQIKEKNSMMIPIQKERE